MPSDLRSGWGGRSTKLRVGEEGPPVVAGMGLSRSRVGDCFFSLITKGRSDQGDSSGAEGALEVANKLVFGSLGGVECIVQGG